MHRRASHYCQYVHHRVTHDVLEDGRNAAHLASITETKDEGWKVGVTGAAVRSATHHQSITETKDEGWKVGVNGGAARSTAHLQSNN